VILEKPPTDEPCFRHWDNILSHHGGGEASHYFTMDFERCSR
jgi:hypothetical protein